MEYRIAKTVSNVLFHTSLLITIGALFCLSLCLITGSSRFNTILIIAFSLGAGLVIASSIVHIKYYRCPHCHSAIRVSGRTPDHCSSCGKELM